MKRQGSRTADLVQRVLADPVSAFTGRSRALRQLAVRGGVGVEAVLRAMSGPLPRAQHPRDCMEALAAVLLEVARRNPQPLIQALARERVPADPHLVFVVWALGYAPAHQQVVADALIRALKHPNIQVRSAAASGLVKRSRNKGVISALEEALRDRSSSVKFEIVSAMKSRKSLLTADTIRPLRRIVQSRFIERRRPGLWKGAQEVLAAWDSEGRPYRSGSAHKIAIHEPREYQGPNAIRATGRGVVTSADGSAWFLLDVDKPFALSGGVVRQVVVAPRYEGDLLNDAMLRQCTVGVSRVLPGQVLKPGQVFPAEAADYFAIGEIRRLRE